MTGTARAWLPSRWARLNGAARVGGVDLARGLAVLGMLAAHLADIPDIVWSEPATWGGIVHGRSSILFATLAGVSIGLVTGGIRPLAAPALATARWRLVVRAVALWVIGMLLISTGVPVYVILPAYAVLFLVALPVVSLRAPALLVSAGLLAAVTPFVYVTMAGARFWSAPGGVALTAAIGWHYPFVV